MGTITYTIPPIDSGSAKDESHGGLKVVRRVAKLLMGATYATSGDALALPTAPPGGTLVAIGILSSSSLPVDIKLTWNGSVSAPKIIAYKEDGSTGVSAQLGSTDTDLATQVVWAEFIYTVGR